MSMVHGMEHGVSMKGVTPIALCILEYNILVLVNAKTPLERRTTIFKRMAPVTLGSVLLHAAVLGNLKVYKGLCSTMMAGVTACTKTIKHQQDMPPHFSI